MTTNSSPKALAFVSLVCLFFLTTCQKETLKVAPTVSISSPTNITSNSVSVSSNISSDGGSEILSRGVCWSITGEPTTSDNKTSDGKGTGSYTSSVTSLSPGTSYNLKSYAVNGAGTAYSSTATFKTLSLLATVSTTDASAVTSTTLNAGGNISNDGGSDVTARGVCWSTNQNPTISDNKTTDGTGKGVFSSSVTALAPGTTYYFRAYATNGIGTSYGNQVTLTVSTTLPTIATAAVSNIGPTSAVAGGNITFNGGETVTERGVYWGTTATPEINGNKLKVDISTTAFEATILNINPNSTYYIKAYATNSKGTAFGNPVTLKTKELTMAIVDISKESEWKYWIVDKNGDYFYMKENSLKPTVVLLKTASSDSSIPIFMDAQGLPEKIMINDYIFIFGNYNGKNVDVAVIEPNGNFGIAKNVETQVNWDLYKQNGGNASNVTLVNLTGRVTGAIPCVLSVAATFTASSASWPLAAWKCGTYLFTMSAEMVEENFNVTNGFADFAKYFGAAKMITGCSTDIVGCQVSMASKSSIYLADQMKIADQKSEQINSAKQLMSDGARVATSPVTSITSNSAVVGGSITTDGVAVITERGVYYGISNSPEISGNKFQIGSGAGNFSSTISGLNAGTTYYVKAYLVKSSGTIYGSQVSFTTAVNLPPSQPATPNPANNATGISTSPTLSWTCSDPENDPLTFDVYFGTTSNPTTKVSADQTAKTYTPTALTSGADYYWKIVSKDNKNNSTAGVVWKFTTAVAIPGGSVSDADGNTYSTVIIGTQEWMASNLKTTKYKDGTAIPLITDGTAWFNLKTPGYCWYNNDAATNKNTYGALYNWYTVNTGKLCPTGWHVPTDAEWTVLTTYLGGESVAGGKLKESGTSHWASPNTGTNTSGFTALGGGNRDFSGIFEGIGSGWWWSSTNAVGAFEREIYYHSNSVIRHDYSKENGFSVRCMKGEATAINQPPAQPAAPSPANNATGISRLPTLSWTCTDPENDPLTFDVYFGTASNPTTKVSADQTDKIYLSQTYLSYGIDYYWKIVAKDNKNNSTESPVWKFTTVVYDPYPYLSTTSVTSITATSAICGGNVTSAGSSATFVARGVCWSTSSNPTTANSKTIEGGVTGAFTSTMTGLSPNTLYYVRAYVTNSIMTGYGNTLTLTTAPSSGATITDADGNTYSTVTIGTQVWMASNLKTTIYKDGTAIPLVTDDTAWRNLTTPGYCWYNNDAASNKSTYGALYNWYTVNTGKLCPTGWHVPTDAEWTVLTTFLGGESVAGGKLKESGTSHWLSPNTGATNANGFTALPGGYRGSSGAFSTVGGNGYWLSSSEGSSYSSAWGRGIGSNYGGVGKNNYGKLYGCSVRCLQD